MSHGLIFPDAFPRLVGKLVDLRELSECDIPAWFSRATDAESAELAGDPIPRSIEEGFVWLQRHRDKFRKHTAIRWAIVPNGTSDSVGTIGLSITSRERRIAELGIVIGRSHWNKGLSTESVQLVSDYAFHQLGLAEIQAEVLQRNPASVRLFQKAGFRLVRSTMDTAPAESVSDACFYYILSCPGRESDEIHA